MPTKNNKGLTLNEKMQLIEAIEKEKLTVKHICERLKCGKVKYFDSMVTT